jgi:hypothetical protein
MAERPPDEDPKDLRLHRGAPEGREQAQMRLHRGAPEGREQAQMRLHRGAPEGREQAQMRPHRGAPEGREQAQMRPHRGAPEGREQAQIPAMAEARPTITQVLAALRAGRTVISTGPSVRFTVDGQPLGALVKGARGKPVSARVVVEAPSWIDVTTVVVLGNGKPLETVTPAGTVRRVDRTLRLTLAKDTWLAVIVRGARPDMTQQRAGVLPFALTNPIWVDADGDGRFTPPTAEAPASRATSPGLEGR